MNRFSGLVATLAFSAALLPAAAPAAAPAAWDRADPRGDAPPPADILHGHTHWEGKSIVIRADVRDLAPTGRFRASLVDDGETIHVFIKKTDTTIKRFVLNYNFEGKHQKIPCKHISVQWNAQDDFVLVRAPLASCVDSGPWGTDGLWLKGPEGAVDKVGKIWWTGD
jgi:hypothetical protein